MATTTPKMVFRWLMLSNLLGVHTANAGISYLAVSQSNETQSCEISLSLFAWLGLLGFRLKEIWKHDKVSIRAF